MCSGWWSKLSCSKNRSLSLHQIPHQQETSSRSFSWRQLLQSAEGAELWVSNSDVWTGWTSHGYTYWRSGSERQEDSYILLVQREQKISTLMKKSSMIIMTIIMIITAGVNKGRWNISQKLNLRRELVMVKLSEVNKWLSLKKTSEAGETRGESWGRLFQTEKYWRDTKINILAANNNTAVRCSCSVLYKQFFIQKLTLSWGLSSLSLRMSNCATLDKRRYHWVAEKIVFTREMWSW